MKENYKMKFRNDFGNKKVYKDWFIDNNTNRFVGFMLPGNPRRLPDDFYFSEYFWGLKWKRL